MKQETQPNQHSQASAFKRFRRWLLVGFLILFFMALVALLIAPHLIATDTFKKKIQTLVAEHTDGQVQYLTLALDYWPRPAIELCQVTLMVPKQVQGKVAVVRVSVELLPLLIGNLHPVWLELEAAELILELSEEKNSDRADRPYSYATLEQSLVGALEPLRKSVPDLELVINNSRLSVIRDIQKIVDIDGLNLHLSLAVNNSNLSQANLQLEVSELSVYHNAQRETLKGLKLEGRGHQASGEMRFSLDRLTLAAPALELTGSLTLVQTIPGINLTMFGSNIDVDATRRVALALAGDNSATKQIFDYLRGGQVPQLHFTTQGDSPSDLGDLKNIHIQGQLRSGVVSIPQINLDLTEVNGEVLVANGILEGTKLSTRLEGSKGHDGTLKVGLVDSNDLFQLELMLGADLAHTQEILSRVVKNQAVTEEIAKITNLQGTASGKLILGDSFSNIIARVDITDLNVTADYQRLPHTLKIAAGQISFAEQQVGIKGFKGMLGSSSFSDIDANIKLEEEPHLEINSGKFDLVLNELYPWATTFAGAEKFLEKIQKLTGHLKLFSLSFKGSFTMPGRWQYAATGAINDLSIETPLFPATIDLSTGVFTLDNEQLTFQNLKTESLDATFTLAGRVNFIGLMSSTSEIELFLNGKLGENSVARLSDLLELPANYSIRPPLAISNSQILWRPDELTSFKGNISLEKGPKLIIDVVSRPKQLQVNRLNIKDRHSDAELVFGRGPQGLNLNFKGALQHETLDDLFIKEPLVTGQVKGDFDVSVPLTKPAMPKTTGRLEASGLTFNAPSGVRIAIDTLLLDAIGAQIEAAATAVSLNDLTWVPVKATIDFEQDRIKVKIAEANLCGINSPGILSVSGKNITFDLELDGTELDVATSYSCLTKGKVEMTGTLNSSGHIRAQGEAGELINTLQGPLVATFTNGTIKQSKMLTRILEVINVTEIVKGSLPALNRNDFNYSTLSLQGSFHKGKLLIEKIYMDAETLDILGFGEIDIEQKTVDFELLAAPFKTVDRVIKYIPGVNYLMAGSIVTIPVSIKGEMSSPRVNVMSASSVGLALKNLGERTLKSPLKLMESFLPEGKKTKE